MLADLKSAKKTENLTVFFALSGSGFVKAERKMLVKLTLVVIISRYEQFFVNLISAVKMQTQTVNREKLQLTLNFV